MTELHPIVSTSVSISLVVFFSIPFSSLLVLSPSLLIVLSEFIEQLAAPRLFVLFPIVRLALAYVFASFFDVLVSLA
ncbi:toxic anion resistance protein, partial [Enterococcus faecalis]